MKLENDNGIWCLDAPTARALRLLMAVEEGRYALSAAEVTASSIAATDGKRLLAIEHPGVVIEQGLYRIAVEGWLIGPLAEGKFPKWKPLLIGAEEARIVWEDHVDAPNATGVLLYKLNTAADSAVSLDLFLPMFDALVALGAGRVTLSTYKRMERDSVFQVTGQLPRGASFTYLQMPIAKE